MVRSLKIVLLIILCGLLAITGYLFWPRRNLTKELEVAPTRLANKQLALLLPHVNLAAQKRLEFVEDIKGQTDPTDIFILSTNHFNASENKIIYDNSNWSESGGSIHGNSSFIPMTQDSILSHELVVNDHGVRNVISDLSSNFPKAKFVSYLVKTNTPDDLLDGIVSDIGKYCNSSNRDCLFVASVDLSHYNLSSIADLHDQFTLSALSMLDDQKLKKAETDSPEVLYMLAKWSKLQNLNSFNLFDQNNTGKIIKNFETEVTSWMIGDYEQSSLEKTKNTTLMFAGDIMMDRLVNHQFYKTGFEHIFDNFKDRIFWGTDASIANLEGPINDGPVEDDISTDNLKFNFPSNSVKALTFANLTGFSLANNHTLNESTAGLDRTRKILEDNNLFSFGSPNQIDEFSLKRLDTDQPISLIGLNTLSGYSSQKLADLISEEKKQGRYVIIFVHWGIEYSTTHSSAQANFAHLWIDQGADLIVGSHPHVVQDSEIYNNRLIVYSLGNFIFDQTFSKETQMGSILTFEILPDKVKFNFVPVVSEKLKVSILKGSDKQAILERIVPAGGYVSREEDGTISLNR